LTSFFVYQNKKNLENQELNNKVNYANQMARNIDQRLASLLKYVDTLYLDSDFKEYIINDGNYYSITRIHEKLRRDMSVFSDLGARIALTKYEDNLFITNQATMSHEEFHSNFSFTDEEQELIRQFYETSENRDYFIFNDSNNINIVLMTVNKYSTKNKLLVIQTITKKNIDPIKENEHLEVIILSESDAQREKIENNHIIQGENIQVTRKSTIIPNLIYVIDLPYSKQSFAIQQYLIGIFLYIFIVFIGAIIAAFFARSMYRPIEFIMQSFEEDEGTKDDEFAFLSKITQDIKHANEKLKVTINENKVDLRTKFIRELIHGLVSEPDGDKAITTYHLKYLSKSPQIILFKVQEVDAPIENYLSEARNSISKSIFTILDKALTIEGCFFELTELNYDLYGLILSDWDEKRLKKMLSKMMGAIEVDEGIDIVAIIGEQVENLYQLNQSYQSCLSVLDYRSSFDKRAIISSSDMEELFGSDAYVYPVDLERDLIISTLQGQNNQVEQIFKRLYKLNFVEKTMKEQEHRNLIMALVGTMRRVHLKIQFKNEEDELEMSRVFENSRYEVEELFDHIKVIFLNYCDIVKKRSQTKAIEYSTEMMRFIKEHYHEDISLEEVSSYLNLSTGYFSTIFKKETGENFKSYLNKYRAQKATEFLRENPNIKIKDLAIQVGYYNVNSFIRMFKKYEGTSPGEYAKNIKSKM
jgi:AraC-like DNA-binding protein